MAEVDWARRLEAARIDGRAVARGDLGDMMRADDSLRQRYISGAAPLEALA